MVKLLSAAELAAITERAEHGVDDRTSIYRDRIALVGHIAAMQAEPMAEETRTLINRLRNTPNWLRESFGSYKEMTSHYDRAPFEAADMLERNAALQAQVEALREAVRDYNSFLRTFHSIASRQGECTNWNFLPDMIGASLKKHHATWLTTQLDADAAIDAAREGK